MGKRGQGKDGRLRARHWQRFLRGPDPELLEQLYVPALARAVRYDRCCAYFSSSVLSAAARGFGRLIERLVALGAEAPRPAVRLVVNEELPEADARALLETGDTSALSAVLEKRLRKPRDLLERQRLEMLAWLLRSGLLDIRVGVMRSGEGIVHAKFGIITDTAGDALVFNGSGNESAQGLLANYERLEVSTSWADPERHREYAEELEALWTDRHATVHTLTLPEAVRLKLIRLAPREPPIVEPSNALARQRAAMLWRYIVEAPFFPDGAAACDATAFVTPWPHQHRVVADTAAAWPDGRLLCDEVGMGKTVEAILILRRLLAGRGVRRVLILLPAGLLKQWQGELREKGGLLFPRLEGTCNLVWPDGRVEPVADLAEALNQDALLMSRETARTEANSAVLRAATPWDLVVLDEAHAARRRRQEEGEFNSATLLLGLLRVVQLGRRARALLLLSATPMQTHPWEPWDLLQVLGEGGPWLADFATVRSYYGAAAALEHGTCRLETARAAALPMVLDPDFPSPPGETERPEGLDATARVLAFAPAGRRAELARWLRGASPLTRRMHRNTRTTLRRYHALGLLDSEPTRREVEDQVFDFASPQERAVYEAITGYIDRRFAELEHERPGKGFVMTVYRRRAASSPYALEQSLRRRREALARIGERRAYDPWAETAEWDARDLDDLGDLEGQVSPALPNEPRAARAEAEEIDTLLKDLEALHGRDTKRDRFFDLLRRVTDDGRAVLVFTEYADTLDYLRDQLLPHYSRALGCYSGEGGEQWDNTAWARVSKDAITAALRDGAVRVLVCTDAASEGLNLQAAGALINYDLPWNPSKVEQRIGRIDRIGQPLPTIRIVNLFLHDSVDERVYRVLRRRCGLFEHFVGPMQPVLARARRMLLGQEGDSAAQLEDAAAAVEAEPLAAESYIDSEAGPAPVPKPVLTAAEVRSALQYLTPEIGVKHGVGTDGLHTLNGVVKGTFATTMRALERHPKALPLSPFEPVLSELADRLGRPGERLPLVVGAHQQGAFRVAVACWLGPDGAEPIPDFAALRGRVDRWDGSLPGPEQWFAARETAEQTARETVGRMQNAAEARERAIIERQRAAVRLRLMRELGRYFVGLGAAMGQFNQLWYQQMTRDFATAQRLRAALERLGGDYPQWPPELEPELEHYRRTASANQRKARMAGKEIDAALQDPRWLAADQAPDSARSWA